MSSLKKRQTHSGKVTYFQENISPIRKIQWNMNTQSCSATKCVWLSQPGYEEFVVERTPKGLKRFSGLRKIPVKDIDRNKFKPHRKVENGGRKINCWYKYSHATEHFYMRGRVGQIVRLLRIMHTRSGAFAFVMCKGAKNSCALYTFSYASRGLSSGKEGCMAAHAWRQTVAWILPAEQA